MLNHVSLMLSFLIFSYDRRSDLRVSRVLRSELSLPARSS